ncbi:MAG: alpha-D-ribose 1-methylphosphonate 5-triphosphate diphosphatase [Sneathiellaceae bacterium]
MPDDQSLRFANARIVTRDSVREGDLDVAGGRIGAPAGAPGAAAGPVEDLQGDFLLPGLVELHTDHLERHYLPRPKVRWNALAAVLAHDAQIAGAGITTVFDALRVGGDADSDIPQEGVLLADAIGRAGAGDMLRADHLVHLRCEVSSADAQEGFDRLKDRPEVRLVSVMDHTPGQRQFVSMDAYRTYYMGKTGMSAAELDVYIGRRQEQHRRYAVPHRRFIVAEAARRGIALASHDDATEAHVDEAVADGAAIAEFPTTMAAAMAARRAGLKVLMGAPNVVLGGSHSGNIAATALAAEGLLDILSSDYVPCSLLQAVFLLPEAVPGMDLAAAVRAVSLNPAAAAGLTDRGEIAEGRRADLVRVRLCDGHPVVRGVWREGRRVA